MHVVCVACVICMWCVCVCVYTQCSCVCVYTLFVCVYTHCVRVCVYTHLCLCSRVHVFVFGCVCTFVFLCVSIHLWENRQTVKVKLLSIRTTSQDKNHIVNQTSRHDKIISLGKNILIEITESNKNQHYTCPGIFCQKWSVLLMLF